MPISDTHHFIVVRHGETEWNRAGIMQGHFDSPLTELGHSQARQVGEQLRDVALARVICSDLGRARETCVQITRTRTIEPVYDARLRERRLGQFQGLTLGQIESSYPDAHAQFRTGNPDYAVPGAESPREFYERCTSVFDELARTAPAGGGTTLVVAHGGVLACVFRYVCKIPLDAPRRFALPNAALNRIAWDGESWVLITWGEQASASGPSNTLDV